jgi:phenylpropionate dioxygenase-like ring-hydroxylating dioxygenase large terminal subunit
VKVSIVSDDCKPEVRPDFVPKEDYLSRNIVELEKRHLWPRVWLMACREEEVEKVGSYVTFNIADESILIVRSDERSVQAFHNVCQHRGRRLKSDYAGTITGKQIVCPFHGWSYACADGAVHIGAEKDWSDCPTFDSNRLGLKRVRMEAWGGWLFVTMEPDIEPLLDYLAPIPTDTASWEFETMRIAMHCSVVVPCNWKVTVDAFNETYHAGTTHRMINYTIKNTSLAKGLHGALTTPIKLGDAPDVFDLRAFMAPFWREMLEMAHCMSSTARVRAAEMMAELPDGMTNPYYFDKYLEYLGQIIEANGGHWPRSLTREYIANTPITWQGFPNITWVPEVDGTLWHRMRPNGDDPNSSIWDIWSLERRSPNEPTPPRQFYASAEAFKGHNPFLEEDLSNMVEVQKGMLSSGFAGCRTSPVQEMTVSHFHKTLREYLYNTP